MPNNALYWSGKTVAQNREFGHNSGGHAPPSKLVVGQNKMKKFQIVIFLSILPFFLTGCDASPFYTVCVSCEGIVTQFGKIVGEPKTPGLNFKIPIIQKVHIIKKNRVRFLLLLVAGIETKQAQLQWTVADSIAFFKTPGRKNIDERLRNEIVPILNDLMSRHDTVTVERIATMQKTNPDYVNFEYKSILTDIQGVVAKYGIRIVRILFKGD